MLGIHGERFPADSSFDKESIQDDYRRTEGREIAFKKRKETESRNDLRASVQ